jgi:steroid 5-alpha reductase family enzyme
MMSIVYFGWTALAIVMGLLWWRQQQTQNATSVDVAWSLGLAGLCVLYAVTSAGTLSVRVLVGSLAFLWGLRLGVFLFTNRVHASSAEDGRYRALREAWGRSAGLYFFFIYQAQAAVAVLFSLPVLGAMHAGHFDGWALMGVACWGAAVTGETIADRQLAAFRANPANRGEVCQMGLWRYSRHPNYFFEWLHWWTYVLIGHGVWLTWIGPVTMLVFLFGITGIPYTERQALKSRGDRYRRYQRTTSQFVPWFPKREST